MSDSNTSTTKEAVIALLFWAIIFAAFYCVVNGILAKENTEPSFVSVGKVELISNCKVGEYFKVCDIQTDKYLIENINLANFRVTKLEVGDTFLMRQYEFETHLKQFKPIKP